MRGEGTVDTQWIKTTTRGRAFKSTENAGSAKPTLSGPSGLEGGDPAITLFWIEPLAGRHIGVRDTRDRRHATHSWFTVD
jgi:hypothetical protein